jgi:cytidine deaminase
MAKAVADGHKKFQAVAVATDISPPASPCGMCRQFMNEFCDAGMPVFMYDKDGKYVVKTMGEVCTFEASVMVQKNANVFPAVTYEFQAQ